MTDTQQTASKRIDVRGVVQGVGFRPFVYRIAHRFSLTGWVRNTSSGVEIEIQGSENALTGFLLALEEESPPLARIESVTVRDVPPGGPVGFEILKSRRQQGEYQLVSPDVATCPDCLSEIMDPADRRYRYPFTNCTNCGPRFTIIQDIPYDRPLTTMRHFTMCPACQAEYEDPLDRRFHAQPNACPACGPHLWILDAEGHPCDTQGQDPLSDAARLLTEGKILAVKGLGGFHLACDATDDRVVQLLRERKHRPAKPLAVMMATLEEIEKHCQVSSAERDLLISHQCPIVLLSRKQTSTVSSLVAPANRYLGVMLPYTPLHHILLHDVARPLVMTSGNLSEEPIASENEEALERLGALADFFVMHNRDIYARYDDSVWFTIQSHDKRSKSADRPSSRSLSQPVRRSRGYAPYPVTLPFNAHQTLACGAELKNSFCMTHEHHAFLSQHIGDLENLETLEHYQASIELLQKMFRVQPEIIAHDLHPDYLATRYALERHSHGPDSVQLVGVQHHHAHIASCLADNGWSAAMDPVIGVAFDGTGYGLDGNIWGGEFLLADYRGFRRAAHLQYMPMPGGEAAILNPYRLAIGYTYALMGEVPELPFLHEVNEDERHILIQQVDKSINTPLTSAVGRLFDAVSAMLGVRSRISYEAQAAMELEMIAWDGWRGESYPFSLRRIGQDWEIGLTPLFRDLVNEIASGTNRSLMSARFHETLVKMIGETCSRIREDENVNTVALSGGCFQNRILLRRSLSDLQARGFQILAHHQVPCNDGGLSLGQAVVAQFSLTAQDRPRAMGGV